MSFIRKIKKKSGTYLAEVENYRKDGKVKQRFIKYLGIDVEGKPHRVVRTSDINITEVKECMNFQAVNSIASELDLHNLLGEKSNYILLMVYSHMMEKLSINKLKYWIEKTELPLMLNIPKIGTNSLYHALDYLESLNWDSINDNITKQWFAKYKESKNSAIIIDVTDTYFNGSQATWKKRKGKDGKYDKLIQIGLAVSGEHGFPLKHRMYEGNISNTKIMTDFISDIKMLGMKSVIIDRGMTSMDSINELNTLDVECIAGIRSNAKLERDFIDRTSREEIFSKNHIIKLKETIVYAKSYDFMNGKLIVVFNPEIEVHQRNKLLAKEITSDNELAKMKYFGYSFIFHSTDYEINEVVVKYYDKDIVEKSFHQIKGVLSLNPIRLKLLDRVSAHIKICYLAYCILSLMKFKLRKIGVSPIEAIDELSSAYNVYLEDIKNDFKWSKIVTLKKSQENILKAIGVNFCSV
jgi:transposase